MKACRFCGAEIRAAAMKCSACGKVLLKGAPGGKWYFRTSMVILAIACVGPFALPLVWWHPSYRVLTKVVVTIAVLVLTYFLTLASIESWHTLKKFYNLVTESTVE